MPAPRLKPREQGDLGELSAMEWFVGRGVRIYIPVFHSPDVDLIADVDRRPLRIQVKTSTCRNRLGRWDVSISTRGGNQSWNRVSKYFDPTRCDLLFVHVGDGRRWLIPSHGVECRSGLTFGGPKYSEFEIEPGWRLIDGPPLESPAASGEYPSGQRGRPVKALAQPSQVRILPPPSSTPVTGLSARTRVSKNHQITIPLGPFRRAGLQVGQAIRVTAAGYGHLLLERIETPPNYAQRTTPPKV